MPLYGSASLLITSPGSAPAAQHAALPSRPLADNDVLLRVIMSCYICQRDLRSPVLPAAGILLRPGFCEPCICLQQLSVAMGLMNPRAEAHICRRRAVDAVVVGTNQRDHDAGTVGLPEPRRLLRRTHVDRKALPGRARRSNHVQVRNAPEDAKLTFSRSISSCSVQPAARLCADC